MRIIVTGHRGFIGTATTRVLIDRGHEVIGIDRAKPGKKKIRGIVDDITRDFVLESGRVNLIETAGAFEADAILNLTGQPDAGLCQADPDRSHADNVLTIQAAMMAANMVESVHTIVHASSAAVAPPIVWFSRVYARDKALAEWILYNQNFLEKHLKPRIRFALRYHNVYGPGARHGVITEFCRAKREGTRPRVYGDGTRERDFVHVEDVALANALALEFHSRVEPTGVVAATLDIGTGRGTSINHLLALLEIIDYDTAPAPENEPEKTKANPEKADRILGFRAERDLQSVLESIR